MTGTTIRISEIFGPTIQGEGALIGQPTIFVRTGGCDYRCSWCDTMFAVDSKYRDEWTPMSAEEIMNRVEELSGGKKLMISLSGGNPATQDCSELIRLGRSMGYRFALETQGSIAQDWFADLDVLTLSPKPPSSGMKTDWAKFEECLSAAKGKPEIALKFVVFDEADYAYARAAAESYSDLPVYLQPGNEIKPQEDANKDALMERMRWIVDRVAGDEWFSATVLPQLHVMLWGNQRGV